MKTPQHFLITITSQQPPNSAVISAELNGWHSQYQFTDSLTALYVSDYPLPDLQALTVRIEHEGFSAFADLPRNAVCAGYQIKPNGDIQTWAARDALGNTPLYVHRTDSTTSISSSPKLLLETGLLTSVSIDLEALSEYMIFRYSCGPKTLLSNVFSPLAGHLIIYDPQGNVVHKRYWDIRETFHTATQNDRDESIDLAHLLDTSLQAESRQASALMFSGGLDSTYLAYRWRSLRPDDDLTLFTLSFPGVGSLDYAASKIHADCLNASHRRIHMEAREFARELPSAIRDFDWPIDHPNFVGRRRLFRVAADLGQNRLLAGEGADTLFGGSWYVSLAKSIYVKRLVPRFLSSLFRAGGRRGRRIHEVLGMTLDELIVFDKTYYSPQRACALLGRDDLNTIISSTTRLLDSVATWDPMDRAFYLAYLTTLSVYPAAQRGLALSCGCDVGYPFLERGVAAFANRQPSDRKVNAGGGKLSLRQTMAASLPASVMARPKSGLPIPIDQFWKEDGLGRYIDLIVEGSSCVAGVLCHHEVLSLADRVRTGSSDREDMELMWVILNLELWMRQVFRGESNSI